MANEALSFELRLVDSVTGVAKRQAAAVKSVETSATRAQNALGKQFEKIGFAAARAAHKQEQAFAASWAKIGMAAQRAQERQQKQHERAAEKAKEHSLLSGFREATGLGRITQAAFMGDILAEGVAKIAESFVEGAKMAVEVITDGIKDAFTNAAKEQVQRGSEKISLGSGALGFREDAERFAKNSSFTSTQIRELMLPMRQAGLGQAASRQLFSTSADIAAARGKPGDVNEAAGISQELLNVYTKRGIGKRQLAGILQSVGGNVPDFYKELGKKMGISAKEAEKKAEEGGLDPQMLINMITGAVNKRQGGAAGSGDKSASKSMIVEWQKLMELPDEYYRKLVDSPGFARANEMLGELLEKLDPESPTGKRIMADLERAFDKVTGALGGGEDGVDGIVDGIENMIGLVADLIPDLKIMGQLLMSSAETVADIIRGARIFFALQNGDKEGAAKIMQEQQIAEGQRFVRKAQEKNERENRQLETGKAILAAMPGNPLGLAMPRETKGDNHWGDAPDVHVHLHGDHKDPEEAGRKAGRAAARELERSRRQRGG